MKHLFLSKHFLFLLTIGLLAEPLLTAHEPVLDTNGTEVGTGTPYYVLPVIEINGKETIGGGFTWGKNPYPDCNRQYEFTEACCTASVAKVLNESDFGLPIAFYRKERKEGAIRLSAEITITVYDAIYFIADDCLSDHIWKFAYDNETRRHFVTSGGDCCGRPSSFQGRNWFRVEKVDKNYVLRACYSFCKACKVLCRDLGVHLIRGERVLAISDVPMKVVFMKPPVVWW